MIGRTSLIVLASAAVPVVVVPAVAGQSAARRDDPSYNYMVNCQGCHKVDGSAQGDIVPALRGQVAKFLHTKEGRRFLVQVPGVSQSPLDNRQTADVLNWAIVRFDRANIPDTFVEYTEDEVRTLRAQPISDTARKRAIITKKIPGFSTQAGK